MSRHSGFELVGDIVPDADNQRRLGFFGLRFAEIHVARIFNAGLVNFAAPLYEMTPQFLENFRIVYGSTLVAFQFRPAFLCLWAGVRLPLYYVGSPPDLNFKLYRWDGSGWNHLGELQISTSDCGSTATSSPTFVVKLLPTAERIELNADDLYEIRIDCETGDGSDYWRLYYDEVSFRDWKGRDCVGYRESSDGGSTWTDYTGRELSVQTLVSLDV